MAKIVPLPCGTRSDILRAITAAVIERYTVLHRHAVYISGMQAARRYLTRYQAPKQLQPGVWSLLSESSLAEARKLLAQGVPIDEIEVVTHQTTIYQCSCQQHHNYGKNNPTCRHRETLKLWMCILQFHRDYELELALPIDLARALSRWTLPAVIEEEKPASVITEDPVYA